MNVGMLWFDNDPKSELTLKVERAAIYYRNKYGQTPTVCFVHPSMLAINSSESVDAAKIKAAGVEVRPASTVLPNHFWIGVNGVNVS
jgi:hypothetical protein